MKNLELPHWSNYRNFEFHSELRGNMKALSLSWNKNGAGEQHQEELGKSQNCLDTVLDGN